MKVYMIPAGYDGCAYVRCLLPQIQNGWWGAMSSLRSGKESNEQMLKGAKEADIVVFQRPMQKEMLEAAIILKEMGKKIVFDNDDTYSPLSGVPRLMTEILERQVDGKLQDIHTMLKEFSRIADLVTVSTDFLADEYKDFNSNIKVLPNMVDPDDWDIPKRTEGNKIRIGIVGSSAMNKDSQILTPILRELRRRDDVQLVMFGIPALSEEKIRKFYLHEISYWNTMNVEWQSSVNIADYMSTLNNLELDIMLIPREDNYFNHCKSNLKFLEASMCEIPVVAQGFIDGKSPYQGLADSKYMRIATTQDDWRKQINELIEDKKLRQEMGMRAKEYVLKNYNIHNTAHLWEEEYKKLCQ